MCGSTAKLKVGGGEGVARSRECQKPSLYCDQEGRRHGPLGLTQPTPAGWLLQGYDGLKPIFQRRLSIALSEREIGALLQRLPSRDLTISEVVSASLRKPSKGSSALLEIRRSSL